jgi:ABC-type antimicrobial peptide transport system permease subunit
VTGIQPLALRREEAVASPRLTATLLASFAGLALLVTALGIGGLIAYSVAQRTRELGIRMALGARPLAVLGLILGQGLRLVALGCLLGGGGAILLGHSMRSLLFETAPADPLALMGAAALLVAVAAGASLVPASRASRIDPNSALRDT